MHVEPIHAAIYADLDPVTVARIVDGWGVEAAAERWFQWSPRAIRGAARRGRAILRRRATEAKLRAIAAERNPVTDSVRTVPAA